MRRRSRQRLALDNDDKNRWLVSYADFMTLLFAFFVVMYAISSVNLKKYKILTEGVSNAFSQSTVNKNIAQNSVPVTVKEQEASLLPRQVSKSKQQFLALHSRIEQKMPLGFFSVMKGGETWFELDMLDGSSFNSASATLTPQAISQLKLLGTLLKDAEAMVAIEGYTDDLAINNPTYPSNWALSAARAAAVAAVLSQSGVAGRRLSATGFGQQFPVASNQSPWGRALNRRVTIVVAKDISSIRLMNPLRSTVVMRVDSLNQTVALKQVVGSLMDAITALATAAHSKAFTIISQIPGRIQQVPTETGGIKFQRTIKR